jgi:NitT/TauT family transport system substrate-binding protein
MLDEQRTAVQALLAGGFKAIVYLQQEPNDAARRMSRRQQTTAEQFLRALEGLHIPSREENLAMLDGDSPGLVTSGAHLMNLMIDAKLLQQAINIKEVLEPAPLKALSP